MKYLYILILIIFSCNPPYPEEDKSLLSDCSAPYGYDCNDVAVLQSFIDVNSEVFRHYMDYNASGILEPLEFGYQVWDKGRLIQLNLNYSPNVIMQQDNPSELDPANYRLTFIPDNIGELTSLESLWLHDNELSYLPDGIQLLIKLRILDLANNLLIELPDIGSLVNLDRLVLSHNHLTSIPTSIGNLVSLERLWIQNNKLESIPASIGNLIQLEWLYLNDNFLQVLPEGIGNLTNLKLLNIEHNMISFIPQSMCDTINNNLSMYEGLETFSIGDNKLCDNNSDGIPEGIPPCIEEDYGNQNCANCDPWEFNIGGYCADSSDYNILQNFLDMNPESQSLPSQTGIPDNADECVNEDWWEDGRLVEITFQHKQLTSIIPENIGNLDKLKILRLTGNYLKGILPESIANLEDLEVLKLNSNYLTGSIPSNIGNLLTIDTLWLTDNSLGCYEYDYECDAISDKKYCCSIHCDATDLCVGGIPNSITTISGLKAMQLEENFLSENIPDDIGDIDSLRYLYLDNNKLEGEIPSSIGNLKKLRRMKLLNNDLVGEIPDSICTIYENNENFRSYLHNNNLCPGVTGYPSCIPNDHLGPQNCLD